MSTMWRRALKIAGTVAASAVGGYLRKSRGGATPVTSPRTTPGTPARTPRPAGTSHGAGAPATRSRPHARPAGPRRRGGTSPTASPGEQQVGAASRTTRAYDVARLGLPELTYSPSDDDQPDPGEVVWTWVPYDDDAARGKDRPVLVLAREGAGLVVAQMTSKDHDRDRADEARWGRHWVDVGSGAWDRQGRESEVRIDRLLWVDTVAVRREGAALDARRYAAVADALRAHHRG
ncbi:type II toxin-antitoxin system PemK/MazF family toxin [Georgenia sp. SYP-B2076]|uniref:type II toxin-antitoxin system PemK/MazF family toxin n=1 Tax=Georgenia sp. SYP-B2076 TaxID=2495881 RepID=UPI000F8CA9F7|nr:type II toxin-antitoxin system PemK/MazF family toxin [Georgenia sp. SYP-B2076]